MSSVEPDPIAALRSVLEDAGDTGDDSEGGAARVYRDGDPIPPAAQASLAQRNPEDVDRRWREVTGQA